jgi:hypothetical protein
MREQLPEGFSYSLFPIPDSYSHSIVAGGFELMS